VLQPRPAILAAECLSPSGKKVVPLGFSSREGIRNKEECASCNLSLASGQGMVSIGWDGGRVNHRRFLNHDHGCSFPRIVTRIHSVASSCDSLYELKSGASIKHEISSEVCGIAKGKSFVPRY
jgi:hypothetical protein